MTFAVSGFVSETLTDIMRGRECLESAGDFRATVSGSGTAIVGGVACPALYTGTIMATGRNYEEDED